MFDVFYVGPKPNHFAFEREAASLEDAGQLSRTKHFWIIDSLNDYSKFDFNWRPVPWEMDHTHVWPSQWQENGRTYFVPKGVTEHKWHWRDDVPQVPRNKSTQIFYMDFLNEQSQSNLEAIRSRYPNVKSTRFVDNYLNMFKRVMNLADTEFVWIVSSICDYKDFDFTWHSAQWNEEMVHVFPSNGQRRGDTFYVNVESFKQQMYELEILDWFNVINYCDDQTVERFDLPVHYYNTDNLVQEVKDYTFKTPYVLFSNQPDIKFVDQTCIWSDTDRTIETYTKSNSVALVPRDVKMHLQTQMYDYPYINHSELKLNEKSLDIIYISNGEVDEQRWWNHTIAMSRGHDIRHIQGVNGRANAYKAAAESSKTPWFFTVFAKLEVLPNFDWNWQPDYLQEPKHYIFHARNSLNGLEYGHMGVIAYNRRLVLDTMESGLDFTLSKAHEVVPVCNAVAHFNADPWMTWRTAFREVVKLKHFSVAQPSVETEYRLNVWLTKAEGQNADWCLRGAADAVDYYASVEGDYNRLLLTFEWAWLREYAASLGYDFK